MHPSIRQIKDAVCDEFAITGRELDGPDRKRVFARPRQVAIVLTLEMVPRATLQYVGRNFGRHHTTVLSAKRHIPVAINKEPGLAESIARLRARLAVQP